MPQDAKCPKCGHTFPVTEARHPFTAACPRCEAELTVEFKKPATPPEAGQAPYEVAVKPGALADSPAPAPKSRKRSDDEEEEKKRGGGSALIVFLSGGFGLLFVLGGLSLTGWYLFTQVDTEPDTVSNTNWNRNNNNNNNSGNRNNNGGNRNNNGNNNNGPRFSPPPRVEPPKPKDRFDLRPVPGALTRITPPAEPDASAPKNILLPGKADAVAVGGGGRYIVFHFPEGRLAVFDANAGDITKEAAVDTGGAMLAAGANVIAVSLPNNGNKLRTYTLPDLRQVREFDVPVFAGARSIAMGAATNGPLLCVNPFGEVILIDVNSGTPIEGSKVGIGIPNGQLRASHDGKTFLAGNGYGQNDKFSTVTESAKKWAVKSPDVPAAYLSADGKRIYGKDLVATPTGGTIASKPASLQHAWFVPAVTGGDYFLRVNEVKIGTPPRTRNGVAVSVHRGRDAVRPILTPWEGEQEMDGLINTFFVNSEPLDKHLFLIPEAKLLVVLNRDKNKLKVWKLPI